MAAPNPPRFVIGTGRCGSTLLSRMLSEHPGVASIFEWFSGIDASFRFSREPVPGGELAARLRQDHPVCTEVMKRGYEIPEVVYPFGRPGMRYEKPGDPVPWTLGIAMPRLCDEPDRLFDEMLAMIEKRPRQALATHYQAIFDWLTERLGRTAWVERSAGSIEFVGELDARFPQARYVHLHRDGRETALSTREYPALRVAVVMMFGLAGDIEFTHEGLSEMARTGGETIDRLLETRPPIELYGRYWSQQVEAGCDALSKIDPARVLDVHFERMVRDPLSELARVRDFFEIEGGGDWLARGARLVHGMPPLRYPKLSADEQKRLDEACAPAMQRLERDCD